MTVYDVLLKMAASPADRMDTERSEEAARFVSYINKRIEWNAKKYIREYNRWHRREVQTDENAQTLLGAGEEMTTMLNRVETAALLNSAFFHLTPAERKVYIGLYQLDWDVSKVARLLGCSESYVCRLNRAVVRAMGASLKGGK